MMDLKDLAAQLRKPSGEAGKKVGDFMDKGNKSFYDNLLLMEEFKGVGNVLEIGMGVGKHIPFFLDEFFIKYFVGLDYSDLMVQESKMNNPSKQCDFVLGDASAMPFKREFDLVITVNTIYFYEDILKVFKEIKRVLKPTGKFILAKRTFEDLNTLNEITQFGFNKHPLSFILANLKTAGLSVEKHLVYPETPAEVNGKTISLHNEFIICSA